MSDKLDKIRQAVVKVFTQSDAPDYEQPWQTAGVESSVGSGLVVDTGRGLRILTNAHVVENQVFVEVRRYGQSKKFVADVEGVGHECDLALLSVANENFFSQVRPLPIGELPMLGDRVTVLGYPIGGDRLSVTQGIVSRIEMSPYEQSQRHLLSVQIDAAINPGNSGGPVIDDRGQLSGVAFQALDEGENIAYMIGSPVVQHFLADMESLTHNGFPDLGVVVQNLTSSSHRRWLGLHPNRPGGVLITDVVYRGSVWGQLKRGDVLLKLGASAVASDATVRFRSGERIHYSYLVTQRRVGQSMQVKFWRKGEVHTARVQLREPRYLVQEDRYDVKPTYFLYGGLLFAPLTRDYLKTWGDEWWSSAPGNLLAIYEGEIRSANRQEVVVLQKVMADRVNQGYHDFESRVVTRVQGQRIRSLKQLVRIVEKTREDFVRFDLEDGDTVVLDRARALNRQDKILQVFGVAQDRSEDLKKIRP